MKNLKYALLISAALSVLPGAAFAGSGNQLYIDQTGIDGTLSSTQSGNNNRVGAFDILSHGRGRQQGRDNSIVILQSGNNNVGTDASRGLDQLGSSGYMYLNQSGNSNTVVGMSQFDHDNDMRIYQTSNGNIVTAAVQDTDGAPIASPSNFMQLVQEGRTGNMIDRASQDGSDNDMYLRQNGARNHIALATQGDFNVGTTLPPGNTVKSFMNILQTGNGNVIDRAQQFDANNSMVLTFTGNLNGTSAIGNQVATALAVGKAVALQSGEDNIMNVSITGADNSFSLVQEGNDGLITGNVLGAGNELAALQGGDLNNISFSVNGNNNAFGIDQSGTGNTSNSYQTGNRNAFSLTQAGSGNMSTISQ